MRPFIIALLLILLPAGSTRAEDKPVDPADIPRSGKVRSGGAILCRNLAMVAFMKQRVADAGNAPPDFKSGGCTFLAEGTEVTIEETVHATIVDAETMFGVKIRGVTDPAMIEMSK